MAMYYLLFYKTKPMNNGSYPQTRTDQQRQDYDEYNLTFV